MSDELLDFRSKGNRLLQVIPALILIVLADVFIACSTAGIVLVQLLASGHNKYFSLITAILIAVGVHIYLRHSHKIRKFIKQGAKNE
jgi:hypothetical protein